MSTQEAQRLGEEIKNVLAFALDGLSDVAEVQKQCDAIDRLIAQAFRAPADMVPIAWCTTYGGRVINTYHSKEEAAHSIRQIREAGLAAVIPLPAAPKDTA